VVGAAVVTGLTNARWQHVNMATSGGNFLMAVNGSDKLRGWNGAAWWTDGDGTHDITGVDTATCIGIALFKRRLWLIQSGTSSVWYLPVDSIAGVASQLDFGSIFTRGGQLMAMADWSIDAGIGIDDYAAFISDQGEVALYKGSDPTSATTWALVGTFWVGAPIGRRCVAQFAGDVLLISKDGLIPLSKALMSSRVDSKIALTDKIQNTRFGGDVGLWLDVRLAVHPVSGRRHDRAERAGRRRAAAAVRHEHDQRGVVQVQGLGRELLRAIQRRALLRRQRRRLQGVAGTGRFERQHQCRGAAVVQLLRQSLDAQGMDARAPLDRDRQQHRIRLRHQYRFRHDAADRRTDLHGDGGDVGCGEVGCRGLGRLAGNPEGLADA
jgi:hypothetical protein